jgi:hypothetical protein
VWLPCICRAIFKQILSCESWIRISEAAKTLQIGYQLLQTTISNFSVFPISSFSSLSPRFPSCSIVFYSSVAFRRYPILCHLIQSSVVYSTFNIFRLAPICVIYCRSPQTRTRFPIGPRLFWRLLGPRVDLDSAYPGPNMLIRLLYTR